MLNDVSIEPITDLGVREESERHCFRRKLNLSPKMRGRNWHASRGTRGDGCDGPDGSEVPGRRWPLIEPIVESEEWAVDPLPVYDIRDLGDEEYEGQLSRRRFDRAIRREGRVRRSNGVTESMRENLRYWMDEEETRYDARFMPLNYRQRDAAAQFLWERGRLPDWIIDRQELDLDFEGEIYYDQHREFFERGRIRDEDVVVLLGSAA